MRRMLPLEFSEAGRKRLTIAICALGALAACGEEPPPHSAAELMEDPILLEATMIRCGQDRATSRYAAECLNAREAAGRVAAAAEQARRDEREAQSAAKRQALRRAQEAAAEARRLSLEAERSREEAANFGLFEPLPADLAEDSAPAETVSEGPPMDIMPAVAGEPQQRLSDAVESGRSGPDDPPESGADPQPVPEEVARQDKPAQ